VDAYASKFFSHIILNKKPNKMSDDDAALYIEDDYRFPFTFNGDSVSWRDNAIDVDHIQDSYGIPYAFNRRSDSTAEDLYEIPEVQEDQKLEFPDDQEDKEFEFPKNWDYREKQAWTNMDDNKQHSTVAPQLKRRISPYTPPITVNKLTHQSKKRIIPANIGNVDNFQVKSDIFHPEFENKPMRKNGDSEDTLEKQHMYLGGGLIFKVAQGTATSKDFQDRAHEYNRKHKTSLTADDIIKMAGLTSNTSEIKNARLKSYGDFMLGLETNQKSEEEYKAENELKWKLNLKHDGLTDDWVILPPTDRDETIKERTTRESKQREQQVKSGISDSDASYILNHFTRQDDDDALLDDDNFIDDSDMAFDPRTLKFTGDRGDFKGYDHDGGFQDENDTMVDDSIIEDSELSEDGDDLDSYDDDERTYNNEEYDLDDDFIDNSSHDEGTYNNEEYDLDNDFIDNYSHAKLPPHLASKAARKSAHKAGLVKTPSNLRPHLKRMARPLKDIPTSWIISPEPNETSAQKSLREIKQTELRQLSHVTKTDAQRVLAHQRKIRQRKRKEEKTKLKKLKINAIDQSWILKPKANETEKQRKRREYKQNLRRISHHVSKSDANRVLASKSPPKKRNRAPVVINPDNVTAMWKTGKFTYIRDNNNCTKRIGVSAAKALLPNIDKSIIDMGKTKASGKCVKT
jgi:hypothetical protein